MSLQVGQLECVAGLIQARKHNGKVGTIQQAFDPSSGRCVVMLHDGSSVLNIKPENLEVTDVSQRPSDDTACEFCFSQFCAAFRDVLWTNA